SARICTLMARIEVGEFGDRGREREWLARALRAPRDRAWIADGYVSDRWLPVSPVTGAVDAFEWKAPVDAIGRGDQTLVIEERPEPPMREIEAGPKALPPAEPPAPKPEPVVEEAQAEASPPPPPPPPARKEAPVRLEERPRPKLFVPDRPPDDPGVAQAETDESPTSLERLRAAQIRRG
ncbi:MAG: heme biosynthesis protein HemY, partial [Methyloceanibacter sp.]